MKYSVLHALSLADKERFRRVRFGKPDFRVLILAASGEQIVMAWRTRREAEIKTGAVCLIAGQQYEGELVADGVVDPQLVKR